MPNLQTQSISIETQNDNPGYSTMLPQQLISSAENDYIAMRVLVPYSSMLYPKIAHNAAECLEKIMKVFLLLKCEKIPDDIRSKKYGHNLENIRLGCAEVDEFFEDFDLVDFCKNYSPPNDGNEVMRYGFQKNTKTYGVNMTNVLNVADKFFLGTFLKLGDKGIYLMGSKIAALVYPTIFQEGYKTNIGVESFSRMQSLISSKNSYLQNFLQEIEVQEKLFEKNKN